MTEIHLNKRQGLIEGTLKQNRRIKMREIKFRAWDKENEKMMKVSSLHLENKEISVKENGTFRLFRMQDLMQYTGVKDKNGKEIYEGDILLSSNENGIFLQLIGFGNDDREYSGILNGFKIIDGRLLENDDYEIDECKEFTQELIKAHNIPILQPENTIIDGWWVIGNIYENKNLLEESK